MPARGGRPPEEGRVRTWTHVGAKPGTEWFGWIAGDAIGVNCHVGDAASTPCLRHYVGKGAHCTRCEQHHRTEWLWYQPIWRSSDGKPVIVICHADQLDVLDRLKVLTPVFVGRKDEKKAGMYIRPELKGSKFDTTMAWKRLPQCIADFLPTLFRLKGAITGELILKGGDGAGSPNSPVDANGQLRLSPEATAGLMHRILGDTFHVAEQPADEALDQVFDRLKGKAAKKTNPEKNGSH